MHLLVYKQYSWNFQKETYHYIMDASKLYNVMVLFWNIMKKLKNQSQKK